MYITTQLHPLHQQTFTQSWLHQLAIGGVATSGLAGRGGEGGGDDNLAAYRDDTAIVGTKLLSVYGHGGVIE